MCEHWGKEKRHCKATNEVIYWVWERMRTDWKKHTGIKSATYIWGNIRVAIKMVSGAKVTQMGSTSVGVRIWILLKLNNKVIVEKGRELMEEIGGSDNYQKLLISEKVQFARGVVREAQICLGERAYQQLSPEEKEFADWWVWSGCTMHKDLNAMKGGCQGQKYACLLV